MRAILHDDRNCIILKSYRRKNKPFCRFRGFGGGGRGLREGEAGDTHRGIQDF